MAVKERIYQQQCWLGSYPQLVVSRQCMRRGIRLNKAIECYHKPPVS